MSATDYKMTSPTADEIHARTGATETQLVAAAHRYCDLYCQDFDKAPGVWVRSMWHSAECLVPKGYAIVPRSLWDAWEAAKDASYGGDGKVGETVIVTPLVKWQDVENAMDAAREEMGE